MRSVTLAVSRSVRTPSTPAPFPSRLAGTAAGRLRLRNPGPRWALLLAVSLILGIAAPRLHAQAKDWKQIQAPPLHPFHPQLPKRIQFSNGMVVFLEEDHELPLIRGTARIRGGSRDEPAGKAGVAEIYAGSWRTGGTKSQTGDQLDDYLEARAARVESMGGLDSTTLTWDCLKENLDDVLRVFGDLLREPEFRDDKIALAKNQANTGIARRNDNPFQIAFREGNKLVYGAGSPYARQSEYATVAAVSRDDLLNWHSTYVQPNNIILGVVGDFDSEGMEAKLRQAFEPWPQGPAAPKLSVSFHPPKPGVYFIQKDDVTASTVQMVDLGTTRNNPDYYAIEVFNEFFGGGFSSRLFSNIRSKKALAYAVGGGVGADYDHPGVIRLFLGTKSATTAAAVEAFNAEIEALKTNSATPDELQKAKESILNSFLFRFDTKEKVLQEQMADEFYGYPLDFLERYRAGVEKVTQADVERVAHQYIHKEQLAVLVVGKAKDFDRPLSSFGTVTPIDITIPAPPGAASKPATAASSAEGKALLAKVVEAMGGRQRISAVRAVREKASVLAKTPQGDMTIQAESVAVFPDRLWQKLGTPMGEMNMVVGPSGAFMKAPMGSQDMPPSQKEAMLKEIKRDPLFIAQHAEDPGFTVSAGDKVKVGDVDAEILDVNADGAAVRWFVDPASGRILRSSAESMGMAGPGEVVTDYSDWKVVDGISLPFKEAKTQGGQPGGSVEIQEVEFNPKVDDSLFEKPAAKTNP